ncbi:MAG TPA: hypothetical protein VML75_03625 [Kofleriaceae bacterium]|nr:hypothetical protein [Kofleriaceae bacterium]
MAERPPFIISTIAASALAATMIVGCGKEAFDDYKRKSINVEARMNLQAIARGAKVYYVSEHMAPGATTVSFNQLPGPRTGPTPPLGTCCTGPSKPKCAPEAAQWADDPVWQALEFTVDMSHYYSYEYKVTENGFSAAAYGDLDCDGQYSTFLVTGVVDPAQDDGLLVAPELIVVKPHE